MSLLLDQTDFRIEDLADHPSHVAELAEWHHAQFGYLNPANAVERYVERLTASLQKGSLPTTFVALRDDALLGSASLVERTITHPHLSPWLSSVFVAAQHRGQGIASALVSRIEREAAAMGRDRIHLFTPDSERLYARLGWQLVEYASHGTLKIAIMSKSLER